MNASRIIIAAVLVSLIPVSIGSTLLFKQYSIHALICLCLVGLIHKFLGGAEVHSTLEKCLWVGAMTLGVFSYLNRENPDALGPGFAVYFIWMITLMVAYWCYSPKIPLRNRRRSSIGKQAPWIAIVAAMIAIEMQNGGLF